MLLLCGLAALLDGLDLQSIGLAALQGPKGVVPGCEQFQPDPCGDVVLPDREPIDRGGLGDGHGVLRVLRGAAAGGNDGGRAAGLVTIYAAVGASAAVCLVGRGRGAGR